ncbi:hypothetical protein PJV92_12035 [Aliarcobacter butzleri]|uniref:HEPN domain-containing protein n=1 Tax=Aliarcobacter butzleri TaxID=28197 RepID=A0AAP4Q0N1_9BACT|nr:hypothetical protein [Aliarcobacter butzleri]MDN5053168.1 hypothetical protein [Aliarcobacter butzleri]MDN5076386.1 hypothetical protein [Aliarcobacter butzleri]MDN5117651.1 hypothetical protein [Aliarcobacter butzleri]MDN5133448.1 hypothetical protein [Aliarcobacter butzleri]
MEYTITSLFNKSLAYLEVAILSSKAKNSVMYNTSEYSNVTAHLLHHATELFLKFAICASTKELPKNEHKISKLYNKYKGLYPEEKFDIKVPFTGEIEYIGFTEDEIAQHEKDYPMSIELQLRYPVGKKGENYSPITKYETDILEFYKKQFLALRCEIHPCKKYNKELNSK